MSRCAAAGLGAGLAAAALALASCGGIKDTLPDFELSSFRSHAADVEFGMSKSQVRYTMKTAPKRRVYEGTQEAWQYCQTSASQERADAFLTVYFHNARVAGIHTYGNRAEGDCENFIRPVEWIADPDRAMAEKKRRREN